MTKENELLAFLTNKDNLPIVIDIMRQTSAIQEFLVNQFMSELKEHLQESAPPDLEKYTISRSEESSDAWGALYFEKATERRKNEYLVYSVQHSFEDKRRGGELTLCVEWNPQETWKHPKVQGLKSVVHLGECITAEGLKKGGAWFRYLHIRQYDSSCDLLASIADQDLKASIFRQVSDCFWPLVQKTFKLVAAANLEIDKLMRK